MALNPPLNTEGIPYRFPSEYQLLERKGMQIEIKSKQFSNINEKGQIYLTTSRMIFVNKNHMSNKFKALDIPIGYIYNIDFKQPIFGSNNLQFNLRPYKNLLPGECEVRLYFKYGGCDKFLKTFEYVIQEIKKQQKQNQISNLLQQQWRNNLFTQNQAFQSPGDPSIFVTQQPQVMQQNYVYQNQQQIDQNQASQDYPQEQDYILGTETVIQTWQEMLQQTQQGNNQQENSQDHQRKYFGYFGPNLEYN